eukprot:3246113-Alexandrium_andersonii.AAC.1
MRARSDSVHKRVPCAKQTHQDARTQRQRHRGAETEMRATRKQASNHPCAVATRTTYSPGRG